MTKLAEFVPARTEEGKTYWLVVRCASDIQTERVLFASQDRERAYVEYLYFSLVADESNPDESNLTSARAAGA